MAQESGNWYVRSQGRVRGPFTWSQLESMRDRRQLAQFDEVSQDKERWAGAATLTALFCQTSGAGTVSGSGSSTKGSPVVQPSDGWFCNTASGTVGPARPEHIVALVQSGQLNSQSLVWKQGLPAWVALRDVPELSCLLMSSQTPGSQAHAGNSRGYHAAGMNSTTHGTRAWRLLIITAAIVLALMALMTFLVLDARNLRPDSSINAATLNDIGQAMGIVVAGLSRTNRKTGVLDEQPCGRGTCFALSPNGHVLTNKGLVEEYERLTRVAADSEEERTKGLKIEPKLWVYFGKDRYDAKVAFKSPKYDIAVLGIQRQGPYFRLAPHLNNIQRARIYALGYPEGPSQALSIESALQKPERKPGEEAGSVLNENDLAYSINRGIVCDVHATAEAVYIQHGASISALSPGGPLILDDGTVLGIHTPVSFDNENPGAGVKKSYALRLSEAPRSWRRLFPESCRSKYKTEKFSPMQRLASISNR